MSKLQPRIEYRVRATGPHGHNRITGPFKDLTKAEKWQRDNTADWREVAHINVFYAGMGPYVIEARYVGPWESIEDAQTRADVVADNTERTDSQEGLAI